MGRSLVSPDPYPDKSITHEHSGSIIAIETKGGKMVHRVEENGTVAELPVKYQIGGRMMGSTFAVEVHDYLFESPTSWFNGFGWDVSPGYESSRVLEFSRSITKSCLYCHASGAKFDDSDGRHLTVKNLDPITCDRCHGPTEKHVAHPTKKNILNPAKLSGPLRDSICEQCHLEGSGRVLNPGKDWTDFQPGAKAEDSFATYALVGGEDNHEVIPASEVEQLAQSKCASAYHGKLWCGSCHNPHRPSDPRREEIKAACTSCHRKLSPASHPSVVSECTSCHMPVRATTIVAHAAHTDHRILRDPKNSGSQPGEKEKVVAWREPPAAYVQRDLGLAELMLPEDKKGLRNDGVNLLLSLPAEQRDHDPSVASALSGYYLQEGNIEQALKFGRQSTTLNPRSGTEAMNLGVILVRAGQPQEAEREFLRAISLDPSLKDAYGRLAIFYQQSGRTQDAATIMQQYLDWNPDEMLFHLIKERISGQR